MKHMKIQKRGIFILIVIKCHFLFFPFLFFAIRFVFNYSLIFITIHDTGVMFTKARIQRTKQYICIHYACSRDSNPLFVVFVLSASCYFIR